MKSGRCEVRAREYGCRSPRCCSWRYSLPRGGSGVERRSSAAMARPSTSSAASPFAALRGGGASGISGLGGAGALGGATTGTVTSVSGSTLYVTNSSGDLVKVTVGPSVTVNRNAKSSLTSLQVGDTVVVQGSKTSNGSVTATSVSATEAGVTSGFPGFGSGAGTGGGVTTWSSAGGRLNA